MKTIEQLQTEIATLKGFLSDWLDQRVGREKFGPACVAMLEIALERTTAEMGRSYARELVGDTFTRLDRRNSRVQR